MSVKTHDPHVSINDSLLLFCIPVDALRYQTHYVGFVHFVHLGH